MKRRNFIINSGIAGLSLSTFGTAAMQSSIHPGIPASPIDQVNIGVITYSFRSMPSSAENLLEYLTQLEITTIELMGEPAEEYAGAPKAPAKRWGDMTDSEKEDLAKYQQELKLWRTKVGMKPFKELRRKYNNNGVQIEIIKLRLDRMSPEELDYAFQVAHAVGAKGITLERSDEAVKKLSPHADQHKQLIGYHNHAKVDFDSWDMALSLSAYNAINLDVGHFVAGTNQSPIPLIEKYHDRILNLHLKDRKINNGENMPWGQGDTPLKEILQLMRDKKYNFMGTIELEYNIPPDSDAVNEVQNCIDFCRNALG